MMRNRRKRTSLRNALHGRVGVLPRLQPVGTRRVQAVAAQSLSRRTRMTSTMKKTKTQMRMRKKMNTKKRRKKNNGQSAHHVVPPQAPAHGPAHAPLPGVEEVARLLATTLHVPHEQTLAALRAALKGALTTLPSSQASEDGSAHPQA